MCLYLIMTIVIGIIRISVRKYLGINNLFLYLFDYIFIECNELSEDVIICNNLMNSMINNINRFQNFEDIDKQYGCANTIQATNID